jgi:hypothetical protein
MTTQSTLFIGTVFALIGGITYIFIGWWLSKRVVSSSGARLAWQAFTIWWFGLAATTLLGAFQNLLGALGHTELPLFITAQYVNTLVACIALWGLVYYLIYLFTGNSRALVPLSVFYMIYYILLIYYYTASVPNSVEIGRWNITLAYDNQLRGPFFVLLATLLLLPQIIGSLAYFTLYFRVSDVTQKYRVLLVSWSIIFWFLTPVIALVGGVMDKDWWQIISRMISLGTALVILMAYLPPRWVKERYGIVSLGDEGQRT